LVSLGRVALDGTKVRASASRHRAMSYDRMVRAEPEIADQVEALLADAERIDAAEDAAYGPDRRGDELPAELSRREAGWLRSGRRRLRWRLSMWPRPVLRLRRRRPNRAATRARSPRLATRPR